MLTGDEFGLGFLYLLPTGIAWVFKKPLIFFPFDDIAAISYTSVLQRTFNLVISAGNSDSGGGGGGDGVDGAPLDFEFSMLDQVDFAGIDAYVRRHGLQDASMAEARKAKRLNINPAGRGGGDDGEAGDGDGEGGGDGELAKAAAEMAAGKEGDDDEEEEDENFDPGSEGESEGEGDSSGDEDEDGGGEGGEGDDGHGEELGSGDEI